MAHVIVTHDADARKAVTDCMGQLAGLAERIKDFSRILVKPNLCGGVFGERGSYTSPVVLDAVIENLKQFGLPILIGEADCSFNDADRLFRELGIHEMAARHNASVTNLSTGPSIEIEVPNAFRLPRLRLSSVFTNAFIISVPVLKTHPWCRVTISMKNMYGAMYTAEKSILHNGLDQNIVDINRVIGPHLTVVDASIAVLQGGFKLGLWVGCPPTRMDTILAGYDFVAVDTAGTRLLNRDPAQVAYLQLAAREGLGCCDTTSRA